MHRVKQVSAIVTQEMGVDVPLSRELVMRAAASLRPWAISETHQLRCRSFKQEQLKEGKRVINAYPETSNPIPAKHFWVDHMEIALEWDLFRISKWYEPRYIVIDILNSPGDSKAEFRVQILNFQNIQDTICTVTRLRTTASFPCSSTNLKVPLSSLCLLKYNKMPFFSVYISSKKKLTVN